MFETTSRRDFLRTIGAGAGVAGLGLRIPTVEAKLPPDVAAPMPSIKAVPKRKLGRTGIEVPPLSLGLAAMGHALYPPEEFEPVVNAAIDSGITYLDVAPNYDVAEERLGPLMAKRRKEVFLAGKVEPHAWRKDDTIKLIETSLAKMRSGHYDLCHIHHIIAFPEEHAIGKGGCLDGIKEARNRGLVKYIGVSGHAGVSRFIPVLETGDIDVVMFPINFVDRFTYHFEDRLIPIAEKHKTAVVAMKVLGGVSSWKYGEKAPAMLASPDHYRFAIRYSMGLPGVTTCVVGLKSLGELRMALQTTREFKPLTNDDSTWLEEEGKWLAAKWKARFGPVG